MNRKKQRKTKAVRKSGHGRSAAGSAMFRPTFVRSCLVLLDGAWARLSASDRRRSPLLDPSVPGDVLLAFRAIGIEEPYCEFLEFRPFTMQESKELAEDIRTATSTEEARRRVERRSAANWFRLDEHAVQWTRILCTRGVNYSLFGMLAGEPPRYETGCGPVEQWITLSGVFTNCLESFRSTRFNGRGVLRSGREMTDSDLVIGITDGRPVLAAGTRLDFMPEGELPVGTHSSVSSREHGAQELSDAGLALLVWAVAHQRLQKMYNRLSVDQRVALKYIAMYLERRTPILDWAPRDFALLRHVRQELIAAAPLWRGKSGPGTPSDPPPGSPPTDLMSPAQAGRLPHVNVDAKTIKNWATRKNKTALDVLTEYKNERGQLCVSKSELEEKLPRLRQRRKRG